MELPLSCSLSAVQVDENKPFFLTVMKQMSIVEGGSTAEVTTQMQCMTTDHFKCNPSHPVAGSFKMGAKVLHVGSFQLCVSIAFELLPFISTNSSPCHTQCSLALASIPYCLTHTQHHKVSPSAQ